MTMVSLTGRTRAFNAMRYSYLDSRFPRSMVEHTQTHSPKEIPRRKVGLPFLSNESFHVSLPGLTGLQFQEQNSVFEPLKMITLALTDK